MANYNLKIIDNKVIFDGHAENQSDCHTLTLLCNLLEKNTKTIDYKMGYAEFELDDLPSENKFWLTNSQTFSINGTKVFVAAKQATSDSSKEGPFDDAFITAGKLDIALSFSQDGVTVHNVGNLQAQAKLGSELDLNSYFSTTSIPSIAPGETALFPFLDNIRLRSIVSNDGQNISEGDIISEDGTKLTVSKIKSVDLTTLSGWASLSPGSYSITIVAKANGYKDSEPSAAVSVKKAAEQDPLAGTWVFNDEITWFDDPFHFTYIDSEGQAESVADLIFNFESNDNTWYGIYYLSSDVGTPSIGTDAYIVGSGWTEEAYKTINITSKLSEVTDGDTLLEWLQANATKQGDKTLILKPSGVQANRNSIEKE